MNTVIEASDLTVRAPGARHARGGAPVLLRGLAFGIAPGERVALVGHNGAGKSTLLRALTGFLPLAGGSARVLDIRLDGVLRGGGLRRLRRQVAQVHQGLCLVDRLSVLGNVLVGAAGRQPSPATWFGRWPAAERRAAMAALARVGMDWAAGRRADSLSGGERQKVAIARALLQRARIVFADEPTASLDARASGEIARLLGETAAESGATLVCVLHDLELLPTLADRAIALRRGEIVADLAVGAGTPAAIRGLLG